MKSLVAEGEECKSNTGEECTSKTEGCKSSTEEECRSNTEEGCKLKMEGCKSNMGEWWCSNKKWEEADTDVSRYIRE